MTGKVSWSGGGLNVKTFANNQASPFVISICFNTVGVNAIKERTRCWPICAASRWGINRLKEVKYGYITPSTVKYNWKRAGNSLLWYIRVFHENIKIA